MHDSIQQCCRYWINWIWYLRYLYSIHTSGSNIIVTILPCKCCEQAVQSSCKRTGYWQYEAALAGVFSSPDVAKEAQRPQKGHKIHIAECPVCIRNCNLSCRRNRSSRRHCAVCEGETSYRANASWCVLLISAHGLPRLEHYTTVTGCFKFTRLAIGQSSGCIGYQTVLWSHI